MSKKCVLPSALPFRFFSVSANERSVSTWTDLKGFTARLSQHYYCDSLSIFSESKHKIWLRFPFAKEGMTMFRQNDNGGMRFRKRERRESWWWSVVRVPHVSSLVTLVLSHKLMSPACRWHLIKEDNGTSSGPSIDYSINSLLVHFLCLEWLGWLLMNSWRMNGIESTMRTITDVSLRPSLSSPSPSLR